MDDINIVKRPNTNVKWWFVKEDLEFKVARGEIKEGEKMPSYANLIKLYDIDRNTSVKVYQNMEAEGLIYLVNGLGYFLKPGAYKKARKTSCAKLHAIIEQLKHLSKSIDLSYDEVLILLKEEPKEA